ncbi:MAG: hypothetical protein U0165_12325 [Polyangiaceae bacterium]
MHKTLIQVVGLGVALMAGAASFAACGGGSEAIPTTGSGAKSDAGVDDNGCLTGEGDVPSTCKTFTGVKTTTQGSCECSLLPKNFEYCACAGVVSDETLSSGKNACENSTKRPVEACGALLEMPKDQQSNVVSIERSTTTEEYSDPTGAAPDVSCFSPSTAPVAGASQSVTVKGYARNFSGGCDSAGVQIEIFKVKRTGGDDDGELGDQIGSAVVVEDLPCDANSSPDVCKLVETSKCPDKRKYRAYTFENVPTETELVIKTSSSAGTNRYSPLYDYNIYITNAEVQNGVWTHDVRAVDSGDYQTIPNTAYGHPTTSGNGAIAGEVHDCGDIRISNATVYTSGKLLNVGYFGDDEKAPLPKALNDQRVTSSLGLYAAYDVAPGKVRVSAAGVLNGELVSLGYYDVRVSPDAITAMTFRGWRPFQYKPAK